MSAIKVIFHKTTNLDKALSKYKIESKKDLVTKTGKKAAVSVALNADIKDAEFYKLIVAHRGIISGRQMNTKNIEDALGDIKQGEKPMFGLHFETMNYNQIENSFFHDSDENGRQLLKDIFKNGGYDIFAGEWNDDKSFNKKYDGYMQWEVNFTLDEKRVKFLKKNLEIITLYSMRKYGAMWSYIEQ